MNYTVEGEYMFSKIYSQSKLLFFPFKGNDYRPRFLQTKLLWYAVLVLLVARIATINFFTPFPKNIFFADITKSDLINQLNQKRTATGLNTLTESSALDQAALLKAQDMVSNNYFAHQSPTGLTPWFWFKQVGYAYTYAGENLAIGFADSSEVFNAWLNSPEHRANLLNPHYKDVGTAIVSGFGSNNTMVVVQLFASPKVVVVPIVNATPVIPVQHQSNTSSQPVSSPAQIAQINNSPNESVQKVLGNTTQPNEISNPTPATKNNSYNSFINFIVYDYDAILVYVSYALLLLVGVVLLIDILANFHIQRPGLIIKSLVVMAILSSVIFLNKDVVGHITPYTITL
jgi:hypothetical protein